MLKSSSHSVSPLHVPSFCKTEQGSSGGCGPDEEKEGLKRLVSFMAHHYQQIFKVWEGGRERERGRERGEGERECVCVCVWGTTSYRLKRYLSQCYAMFMLGGGGGGGFGIKCMADVS